MSDDTALWCPTPDRVRGSALDGFRAFVSARSATDLPDSVALHQWSVTDPAAFWELAHVMAVRFGDRGTGDTITRTGRPPGATFYAGARANYAEHVLAGGTLPGAGDDAIIYRREDGFRSALSWAGLGEAVAGVAAALQACGVAAGDRVAAWLPNTPATVVGMLAANSLGAVFTSASPDFGPASLADRFAQVEPKVLLVADGYIYGGREHDRLGLLPDILALLPSVTDVFVHLEVNPDADAPSSVGSVSVHPWPAARAGGLTFVQQEFGEPGFILYSSGTTGRPKCIVHSAMGLLVKHWTEHVLHSDIRPGDTVFYYTTCGWMMWNWLVGALTVGATIVLYDGSPFAPTQGILWDVAESEGVTFFGTSAKYLDGCRKAGLRPRTDHDLSRVRTIASTGSPLSAQDFAFVYESVATDAHLASISGGTDICGCFVLGDPTRPVYAGEIQGPALGVDVDVLDEAGRSLREAPGQLGDMVCRAPFPSMPLAFWGDPDGSRYRAAYFEAFDDVWTHGDFASWTDHDGIVIAGRSDATLNAAGVRIGTAEIYRQVEAFDEVLESLAIAQDYDGDTRIVLFLRLAPGSVLDEDLTARVKQRLRTHASPRHVPAVLVAVEDLPRTRSGKLAELAVADVVNGRPVRNLHALANPDSLDLFRDLDVLDP